MQLTHPHIKKFPLECCVYVTASHLSIAFAVPLPLINRILLLMENLSVNTRHFQSVWDSVNLQQTKSSLRRKKRSVSFLEIYLNTNQEFLFRDKIYFEFSDCSTEMKFYLQCNLLIK